MLEVRGIVKRFGQCTALQGVGFTARPGEILGILGPNGAGKTTLLECLAALSPAQGGEVLWEGKPVATKRRRDILFYGPDGITPFSDLCVGEVTDFFRKAFGRSLDEEQKVVAALALGPVLAKPLGTLSKGYRKRALLSFALLSSQPVLLLDEPFDGFDLRQTLGVVEILRREAGHRILVVSLHQMTDAQKLCDRFLLLVEGRPRGEGSLDSLRAHAGLSDHADLEEVFLALT